MQVDKWIGRYRVGNPTKFRAGLYRFSGAVLRLICPIKVVLVIRDFLLIAWGNKYYCE
ncbi:MAG: hypothetical protein ACJAZ4_001151 [Neptuniibacter pectenicola]|jgi:hypothetical protein